MISKKGAADLLRAAMLRARVWNAESGYAQGLMVGWHSAGLFTDEEYRRLTDLLLNLLQFADRPFPHKRTTY